MRTKVIAYTVVFLYISARPTLAQEIDTVAINRAVNTSMKTSFVKGLSIGIVSADGWSFTKGYGAHLGENMDMRTPLFVGSVTKVITAIAITKLKDQGRLDFDDQVAVYLSNEDVGESIDFGVITIRHLLHHHSGFSKQSGYERQMEFYGDFSSSQQVSGPGEEGHYSSVNYALLGMIIEKVSGMSYGAFVDTEVFAPLSMSSSSIPTPAEGQKFKGYTFYFGLPFRSNQMEYGDYIVPAGYMVSTPEDLGKLLSMLLNEGKLPSGASYLEPSIVKEMFTPYKGGKRGYGMSWGIGKIQDENASSHSGMTKISSAQITLLPQKGLALVVLSNTNTGPFGSVVSQTTENLISTLSGQPVKQQFPLETFLRIVLGISVLLDFYFLFKTIKKWKLAGFPLRPQLDFNRVLKAFFQLLPFVALIVVPGLIQVSLDMLLRIMPDYGLALLIGGVFSLPKFFVKLTLN